MSNMLDDSIAFIESRLTDKINLNELAEQAFFSKTHYQRLFRAIVGEPVMKYVKNRRLQLACRDLFAGNIGILEISLKYGYDSHDGFTRAFKTRFGATPSEYRKRGKLNKKESEIIKMLSRETLNRIGQNAEKVSAALGNFANDAKKLAIHAYETAEAAGLKGITTVIVANELVNLSKRIENFRNENVKGLAIGNVSAFEMSGKIFDLIRYLDDCVFQMNLLRNFSGIETGRIGSPEELSKKGFAAIDDGYAKLFDQIAGNKEHMIALINEAIELIHADIRQEAANCIESFAKTINKATVEGENTVALVNVAADSLKYGRAFMYIANVISESISELKNMADNFNNALDINAILARLGNVALSMNISAFNISIESARVGNTAESLKAAKKVMKYAEVLQKAYSECRTLLIEYERLTALTKHDYKQSEQAFAEKRIDDIIFQSEILSGQFALEAERINRDTFRNLAKNLKTAHIQLIQTRDVIKYRKVLETFLNDLNIIIFGLDIGGSFAYFAKEFEVFIKHI